MAAVELVGGEELVTEIGLIALASKADSPVLPVSPGCFLSIPNPSPALLPHKSVLSWGKQDWCHWTNPVIHLGQFPSLFFCVVAHTAVLVKSKFQFMEKWPEDGWIPSAAMSGPAGFACVRLSPGCEHEGAPSPYLPLSFVGVWKRL